MKLRLSLLLASILLAANFAVAGGVVSRMDTLRANNNTTYYDPTDYDAVRRYIESASRKSFTQRIFSALTQPLVSRENIIVAGNVGIAYSQEVNLAFTAAATAMYKSKDNYAPLSTAALAGMVSVNGFYRVRASGENYFNRNSKLQYEISGGSMPVRFWGLGYDAADNNIRSEYTRRSFNSSVIYMHHFVAGLWGGAGVNLQYVKGDRFEPLAEEYLQQGGQHLISAYTSAIALRMVYDTRDNKYATTQGAYLSLTYELRPKALGNYDKTLNRFIFQADYFQPLWRGGIMAVDVYADLWSSATPWFYWPSIGGTERMRGYYLGRYTERKMITAQVELRQNVWGPIGLCAWGGAGSIFDKFNNFETSKILPNGGLGLRFAVNDRTALRVDYGFGRNSQGLIINVNEAF